MPELPEVETIVRHLRREILGKRIVDFSSDTPKIFRDGRSRTSASLKSDFDKVKRQVIGRKILSLDRIGKNILFNLSGGVRLAIHLMMTGKLLIGPREKQKHDRFQIQLSGGKSLIFNDIRKFGRCRVFSRGRTPTEKRLDLNRDALGIKLEKFRDLIKSRRKIIKNFLLEQKAIVGIGNIYADEILWSAGIHPLRKTESLNGSEIKNLHKYMRQVLQLAIKKGGTSARDYRRPDDTEGEYYKIRKVYQRTGKPCSRDSVKIQRIVTGGRSTHFCPKHQK